MVGMQHDRNAVILGDGPHVHGQGDGTNGRGIGKFQTLTGDKGTATIGNLNDNGRLGLARRFEDGIGRRRTVVIDLLLLRREESYDKGGREQERT